MKKNLFLLFIIFTTIAFGANEKIVLVTGEWEPYTSEKMDGKGFCSEIVTAAFKEVNINVEYSFVPWKRAEEIVLKGEAFAAFPYMITEERQKNFNFSEPFVKSKGKLFYIKNRNIPDDFTWKTYEDFKSYSIAGTLGYWYEKTFKDLGIKLDMAPKEESAFQKLYANRVDFAISDEIVGWQTIKNLFPKDINKFDTVEKSLNESDLSLMISKTYPNSKELTQKFNEGLKKIKENGKYKEILKKYNLKQ